VSRGHHARGSRLVKTLLVVLGLALGVGQLALGAFLASGNNGWSASLLFSVIGLVGAVLGCYAWSSRRSRLCMTLAGIAVGLGVLGSMGLMLDVSQEASGIVHAWSQVPFALLGWVLLWAAWIGVALARVLLFEPPRTRHRLSSRRGDAGN
jgi:hypothetical protein